MQLSQPDNVLIQSIESAIGRCDDIAVAVSGGGDSMALLHLLHHWSQATGAKVWAVTVDHGLRDASVNEAKGVAAFCADLGISHTTLRWSDWGGTGNLQDQARLARQRLMADWAKQRGIDLIALGHTLDDQAETVLMRLARGSGVDGLSGMAPRRCVEGITWVRPFLMQPRQALRDHLEAHNVAWVDDPSNDDMRFDRVKVRRALDVLTDLGITRDRLSKTAHSLQHARHALELQTGSAAQDLVTIETGDVVLDVEKFNLLPEEIAGRLLSHALQWVASAPYRPRRAALDGVLASIKAGKGATLHGCRILVKKSQVRIFREYQAVKDLACPVEMVWDQRLEVAGPYVAGQQIRVLGEAGLAQCPDWKTMGTPRASLLSSPAVWQNQTLIAAPLAGFGDEWRISALFGLDHFISSIKSH